MKKFYTILTILAMLFVLNCNTCSANGDTNFGVHMGTGQSYYSGDIGDIGGIDLTVSEERTNMIGVYTNFSFPNIGIQLQPELNYICEKFDLFDMGIEQYTFEYLQLPVLVKLNSADIMGAKVFASFGPYTSVLLNDQKDIINRMDYGYVLSAGVTIHDAVSFEFRHDQGLVDVSNVDGISMHNSKDIFLVGFNF